VESYHICVDKSCFNTLFIDVYDEHNIKAVVNGDGKIHSKGNTHHIMIYKGGKHRPRFGVIVVVKPNLNISYITYESSPGKFQVPFAINGFEVSATYLFSEPESLKDFKIRFLDEEIKIATSANDLNYDRVFVFSAVRPRLHRHIRLQLNLSNFHYYLHSYITKLKQEFPKSYVYADYNLIPNHVAFRAKYNRRVAFVTDGKIGAALIFANTKGHFPDYILRSVRFAKYKNYFLAEDGSIFEATPSRKVKRTIFSKIFTVHCFRDLNGASYSTWPQRYFKFGGLKFFYFRQRWHVNRGNIDLEKFPQFTRDLFGGFRQIKYRGDIFGDYVDDVPKSILSRVPYWELLPLDLSEEVSCSPPL